MKVAGILVATDAVADADLVKELRRDEFDHVVVSTDPDKAVDDFDRNQPDILILAFNNLEKTERHYLGLYRWSTLRKASPAATLPRTRLLSAQLASAKAGSLRVAHPPCVARPLLALAGQNDDTDDFGSVQHLRISANDVRIEGRARWAAPCRSARRRASDRRSPVGAYDTGDGCSDPESRRSHERVR